MKWTPALQKEYLKKMRWFLFFAIGFFIMLLISVWLHRWLVIIPSFAMFVLMSYSWWSFRETILGRK
ncbi:hypothetical protein [Lacticaseibacillus porcinae]|uniref:hypothetical protein n=1 Tax=Lacticaseibacillus porcinae TaxID=1123687 RepID=UPI000F7A3C92|nr:hypothetical protein [Lacticaseibacillus porcinae]